MDVKENFENAGLGVRGIACLGKLIADDPAPADVARRTLVLFEALSPQAAPRNGARNAITSSLCYMSSSASSASQATAACRLCRCGHGMLLPEYNPCGEQDARMQGSRVKGCHHVCNRDVEDVTSATKQNAIAHTMAGPASSAVQDALTCTSSGCQRQQLPASSSGCQQQRLQASSSRAPPAAGGGGAHMSSTNSAVSLVSPASSRLPPCPSSYFRRGNWHTSR